MFTKKKILFLVLLISINFSFSQTKKLFYNNGNLFAKGNMDNEKKDGNWVFYHQNGKDILAKGNFKTGKEVGIWKLYKQNGSLYQKGKYINGKKNGKWLEGFLFEDDLYNIKIYKSGELINPNELKTVYLTGETYATSKYLDGEINGDYNSFYKNGNLKESGKYIKGNVEGVYTSYFENGDTESIERYKNGDLNGESMSFFEDGSLQSKIKYLDDEKNGYGIQYLEKDKLLFEGTYKNGEKSGKVVEYEYYDDNSIKSKEEFNGKYYNGEVIYYFENGNINVLRNYINDDYEGIYKQFFKNGTLKTIGKYSNDKKTGEWRAYFYNGKLESVVYYIRGNKEGEAKYYSYEDSKSYLKSKGDYINDDKNGIWYSYESDRSINSKITYKDGYSTKKIYATKIFFKNSTRKTTSIILRYRNTNDEWVTKGWFNIKPGEKSYIRKVLDTKYYFYAEGGKTLVWRGDESRKFKGKYYPMIKRDLPASVTNYSGNSSTQNLTSKN